MLDVETGETSERRFGATREELNDWAMPLQGRLAAVAIEATNGWRWVWRELSAGGFDVLERGWQRHRVDLDETPLYCRVRGARVRRLSGSVSGCQAAFLRHVDIGVDGEEKR
jgi:hypothetical protein